ncbi:phosphoribosylformylglycinamidine synthase subunit PurL [Helicobacter sp. 11S02629-2]|uniref:phosphoribosylformylglycinamidine synthase subunit PurL n=1 Tax=Helicobacter sp. 11S02629-2 TaxID=1476195 RepID=UPI000BA4FB88|nr:phosphoribosylformylglycinamidine synthase subunit PurL [Helicobacter sp. 11S02629-2]PAF45932.1 phosphoribosylformylglycinamidine synthase II [Helicobacter sp. 11S02629-2]
MSQHPSKSNHFIDDSKLPKVLKQHKLSEQDYKEIKAILGRIPNFLELGIFSAMWSEHCSYKSSRKYLKGLFVEATQVVQGPGENAGIIDLGDNLCAVFKMESHNHPSFIEPHAGAATGVGGIMRDVFTMGADLLASLNFLCFGDIESKSMKKLHTRLVSGVSEGIAHYGNCMGVPTIASKSLFEPCYNGNILVNAFSLGLVERDKIFYAKTTNAKNTNAKNTNESNSTIESPVIYVGSKTGKDGLGGAVMSSDSFGEDSKSLKPTVQIGDPFTEKLLLDACLEVFNKDLIIGIQDMGAAGLTSSSFEMASRSESGMRLDLDKVPMREEGMSPYDLMLSESQERMLLVAKAGKEEEVLKIFESYELSTAIIGKVTNTKSMELYWHGECVSSMPIAAVTENAPMLERALKHPDYLDKVASLDSSVYENLDLSECLKKLLSSPEIANKAYIYDQFDDSIKASTLKGCASLNDPVIALPRNMYKNANNASKALSMALRCYPRKNYLNPKEGVKQAILNAALGLAINSAKPLAITDCLNFGSPENPSVMWQFKESIEGIKEACIALDTPVVSGNVSLYNQSVSEEGSKDIYPTPSIVMVGLASDKTKVLPDHFVGESTTLCVIGDLEALQATSMESKFAGASLQKILREKVSGSLKSFDVSKHKAMVDFVLEATRSKLLLSALNVEEGGLAVAITKMAIKSQFGCMVKTSVVKEGFESINLFAENTPLVLCELSRTGEEALCELASKHHVPLSFIGVTSGEALISIDSINISLDEARTLYNKGFIDTLA